LPYGRNPSDFELRPAPCSVGHFHLAAADMYARSPAWGGGHGEHPRLVLRSDAGTAFRRPTGRMHPAGCPTVPFALRVVFFHCFPLFLRRRLFSSPRKALACNWRAFSIVNRLYFSKKFPSNDPRRKRLFCVADRLYLLGSPKNVTEPGVFIR